MKDDMGDRLKALESVETSRRLDISLPIYARIDGRGFSKFTRGLRRPYDERMSMAMIETTKHLVKNTGALLGYTQSDEISLGWHVNIEDNPLADMFFSGKVQKLSSVLASMATAAFTNAILKCTDPEFSVYAEKLPHFDCRVFNLPTPDELANAFLWRELDATRNAVSMAAFDQFSHLQLYKVNVTGMRNKLAEAGIDFEAHPDFFKRGTFVRSQTVVRPLTTIERANIPEAKRPAPDATFTRSLVDVVRLPPMLTIANRKDVIYGADPILKDTEVDDQPGELAAAEGIV